MGTLKLILISSLAAVMLASCGTKTSRVVPTAAPRATASGNVSNTTDGRIEEDERTDNNDGGDVRDMAQDTTDGVGDIARNIGDAAGNVADEAGDIVNDAGDAVGGAARGVGDTAENMADGAGDAMGVNDANGNGQ